MSKPTTREIVSDAIKEWHERCECSHVCGEWCDLYPCQQYLTYALSALLERDALLVEKERLRTDLEASYKRHDYTLSLLKKAEAQLALAEPVLKAIRGMSVLGDEGYRCPESSLTIVPKPKKPTR